MPPDRGVSGGCRFRKFSKNIHNAMAEWRVEFSGKAESDLRTLDRTIRRHVFNRIRWLSENFDVVTSLPLHGKWKGFLKLRVGDWRVVYSIDVPKRVLKIHYIDHRGNIYKRGR